MFARDIRRHPSLQNLAMADARLDSPAVLGALIDAAIACGLKGLTFVECGLGPQSAVQLARLLCDAPRLSAVLSIQDDLFDEASSSIFAVALRASLLTCEQHHFAHAVFEGQQYFGALRATWCCHLFVQIIRCAFWHWWTIRVNMSARTFCGKVIPCSSKLRHFGCATVKQPLARHLCSSHPRSPSSPPLRRWARAIRRRSTRWATCCKLRRSLLRPPARRTQPPKRCCKERSTKLSPRAAAAAGRRRCAGGRGRVPAGAQPGGGGSLRRAVRFAARGRLRRRVRTRAADGRRVTSGQRDGAMRGAVQLRVRVRAVARCGAAGGGCGRAGAAGGGGGDERRGDTRRRGPGSAAGAVTLETRCQVIHSWNAYMTA